MRAKTMKRISGISGAAGRITRRGALALVAGALATDWRALAQEAAGPPQDSLRVIKDRYLFASQLARGKGDRVHLQFARGDEHYWEGWSAVGYAVSDDDGRTWTERSDAVANAGGQIYDRFGSFGAAPDGRLITMFCRRDSPKVKQRLFQTTSDDDGETWSAPRLAAVTPLDNRPPRVGWMYTYGPVRTTPSGALVVMSYSGTENFSLVSRDRGETWTSRLIIDSAKPNYSEFGLTILSEEEWLVVGRIDLETNRMAQFITRDAGKTWTAMGPLNVEESLIFASPMLDQITVGGKPALMLSYCDRRIRQCVMRLATQDVATESATSWGPPQLLSSIRGRSGYQNFLPAREPGVYIVTETQERTKTVADIEVRRVSLKGLKL